MSLTENDDKLNPAWCHVTSIRPMKPTVQVLNDLERETHKLRQANAQAKGLLLEAGEILRAVLQDEAIRAGTPMEAWTVMDTVAETMDAVCRRLEQQGLIRRVPHQARAIELTIAPDWIPPLDRPFKF